MPTLAQRLVGAHEIEAEHGVPRYKIARLSARGNWVEPVARLRAGDIYDAAEVATKVDQLRQSGLLSA